MFAFASLLSFITENVSGDIHDFPVVFLVGPTVSFATSRRLFLYFP